MELLECKDYIVPLNPDVIVKQTIYRSSARITNQQRDQVKRVLHKQGYQGRISSIRYTRVNYKYSFKVSVKYQGVLVSFWLIQRMRQLNLREWSRSNPSEFHKLIFPN